MQQYLKYITALLACASFWVGLSAQEKPAKLMERFQGQMQAYTAVEMHIKLSGMQASGLAVPSAESQIFFQSSDYALISEELEVYVQGGVKWSYMPGIAEAVVAENDASNGDLLDNPLILFSPSFSKFYKLDGNTVSGSRDGEATTEILCRPLDKRAAYSALHLVLRQRDLQPLYIKLMAIDGAWYQIDITQFTVKDAPFPVARFNFSPEAHPGVYVTDLR